MSLETLKTAKPEKDEDGNVTLGPWIVRLKEPILEEYGGKFEQTDDGKWTATMDEETKS